ncbi:FAD:protein FMN transferase [Salinibius halmophilus]|uniref:FAD:protein FMN transferase n=1 Tax=Salinibius halmophilus TaxID=1853216 RepID=UPI000E673B5B|nr:FAD:protein FMN transferase [Salinibius halmophilus]
MPITQSFKAMGSPCELYLDGLAQGLALPLLQMAQREVQALEQKYSRYLPGSLLSQWHGGDWHQLDEESAGLFAYADACFEQSDGLFDPSSGILRQAWDFKSGDCNPDLIESLLPKVGWQKLERKDNQLRIPKGMAIDFGGIVKEYAADKVASLWLNSGVRHGLVNLGGDIRAIGAMANGQAWRVGVSDPRNPKNAIVKLSLVNESLASSGDYQRVLTLAGKRYSHMLSPFTGWPVSGLQAVSVKAPLCVVAGSMSTIAMLKGAEGLSWLADQTDDYFAVDSAGDAIGYKN